MKLIRRSILLLVATAATTLAGSPFDVPSANFPTLPPEKKFAPSSAPAVYPLEFRSFDGSGNNPIDPLRGSAPTPLLRMVPSDYADGIGLPPGALQKSARMISDLVVAQEHDVINDKNMSDYLWQWGQFLDHDMDLTPTSSPAEAFNVLVPLGDPQFDPNSTGTQVIELARSVYTFVNGARQQTNVDTAFIDASQVYGSDGIRAKILRTSDDTGRLRTSPGNLLPYNIEGLPNAPTTAPEFFLAGDVRANEQVGLTVMHTLFLREHNYWAGVIKDSDPSLNGDAIYFRARAIVGAEIQIITYRDFLPKLLGGDALGRYQGYRPEVNPGIANVFSTAAFRVGHTMLSPNLRRLDSNNQSIGDLSLADCFFNPKAVSEPGHRTVSAWIGQPKTSESGLLSGRRRSQLSFRSARSRRFRSCFVEYSARARSWLATL